MELGKYSIVDTELIRGLIHFGRRGDFRGVPSFDDLPKEIEVVKYDDGGFVTYIDGGNNQYTMEEYPFERIYKKMEDIVAGKLNHLESDDSLTGSVGSIPTSSSK